LDIPSKSTFRKLIAASLTEDQTIIMATHQVRDLANLVDRIIVEHNGKIILNQQVDHIAEKLIFGLNPEKVEVGNLIYKADNFNPNDTISLNLAGEPGLVDIESLFTAAVTMKTEISKIFNS